MANDTVISLEDFFCEVGGHRVTGYAESAIKIPTPENPVSEKKGLDSVAWIKQHSSGQSLPITISLLADSESVKVLKTFEKTNAIIPFRFEWEELGIFIEALECRVHESGELEIGTDMPEIVFTVTAKNFVEMKGI